MNLICPLCKSSSKFISLQTRSESRIYHRCEFCTFVFLDNSQIPEPDEEKRRYELHENSPDNEGYVNWLNNFIEFSFRGLSEGKKSILDFGSGPEPVMVRLLEDMGHEVSKEDVFFAPERQDGPFDLITSSEVFEHLSQPGDVMQDLAGRLSAAGRLSISTEFLPDAEDLFESWHYRSDPTHIGFFTPESLKIAAERSGLKLVDSDDVRYAVFELTCPPGHPMLG